MAWRLGTIEQGEPDSTTLSLAQGLVSRSAARGNEGKTNLVDRPPTSPPVSHSAPHASNEVHGSFMDALPRLIGYRRRIDTTTGTSPGWESKRRRRLPMRTRMGWCTATSSRLICCLTSRGRSG